MRLTRLSRRTAMRNACLVLSIVMIAAMGLTALAFTNSSGENYYIDAIDANAPTDTPPALVPGQTWTDKTVTVADTSTGVFNIKLSALTRGYSVSSPQYEAVPHTYPGNRAVILVDFSGSIKDRVSALKLAIEIRDGIIAAGRGKNEVAFVGFHSRVAEIVIPDGVTPDDINDSNFTTLVDEWTRYGEVHFSNRDYKLYAEILFDAGDSGALGARFGDADMGDTNIQLAVYKAQTMLAASADGKTPSVILLSDGLPTLAYTKVLDSFDLDENSGDEIGNGRTAGRELYKTSAFAAQTGEPDLFDVWTMNQIEAARAAVPGLAVNLVKLETAPGFDPPLYRDVNVSGYTLYSVPAVYTVWNTGWNVLNPATVSTAANTQPLFSSADRTDPDFADPDFITYVAYGARYYYGFVSAGVEPAITEHTLNFTKLSGYYDEDSIDGLTAKYAVSADWIEQRYVGDATANYNALTGSLVITDTVGAAFRVDKAAVEALAPTGTSVVFDETTRVLTWTIPAALVPQLPAAGNGTGLAPITVTFPVTFDPTDSNLVSSVTYYTNAAAGYSYTAAPGNPFEQGARSGALPNNGWMSLYTEELFSLPPSLPLELPSPSPSPSPSSSPSPSPSDESFDPPPPPLTGGTPYFLIFGLIGAGFLTTGVVLSIKK